MSRDKALVGAAGEYYVAFRLSAMGYAVGPTARGTKGADLLVTNLETCKSIAVQVKTGTKAVRRSQGALLWSWRVGVSGRHPPNNLYYAFVDLGGAPTEKSSPPGPPGVFIVHPNALPGLLDEFPTKDGRIDVWCNIEEADKEAYFNRWETIMTALGLPP